MAGLQSLDPTHEDKQLFFSEALNASALVDRGIASLEVAHPPYSASFPALLLLGAGIERLCKLTLWLFALRAGRRMTSPEFRQWNHRVTDLVDKVVELFPVRYRTHTAALADYEFVRTDSTFRSLLSLIHGLAESSGRYYYLERLGASARSDPPEQTWRLWDDALAAGSAELVRLAESEGGYKYYYALSVRRRVVVERFLRAFCRLYAPPVLNGTELCSPSMIRWASLPDDAIGKTDYNVLLRWQYDVFRGQRVESAFAYMKMPLRDFPTAAEPCALLDAPAA